MTDAVIESAQSWCASHSLSKLLVCPYAEVRPRLEALGFAPITDPPASLIVGHSAASPNGGGTEAAAAAAAAGGGRGGSLSLRDQFCEESTLHAFECAARNDGIAAARKRDEGAAAARRDDEPKEEL